MRAPDGDLIIHDHVDDSRLTATRPVVGQRFRRAWALRFNEDPTDAPTNEDFVGLHHLVVGPSTVRISCIGVIDRLRTLLLDFPLLGNEVCRYPLPGDALLRLRLGPSPANPLVPHLVEPAQRICGTVGFVSNTVRPDATFGYCTLSRYLNPDHLTAYGFRLVVRLGHYIVSTCHLHLYLTAPPRTSERGYDLLEAYVDSSHGNGEDGASHGGFILSCAIPPGSRERNPSGYHGGSIAWKTLAPRCGDDSSGAAELRLATLCYKYLLSARTLLHELDLDVHPTRPTDMFTDANVLIEGSGCERLRKSSRWMATRYAMIRWGIACGTMRLRKLLAADNNGDILTKALTGRLFDVLRARVLGMPFPPFPDAPTPPPLSTPAPASFPAAPYKSMHEP